MGNKDDNGEKKLGNTNNTLEALYNQYKVGCKYDFQKDGTLEVYRSNTLLRIKIVIFHKN